MKKYLVLLLLLFNCSSESFGQSEITTFFPNYQLEANLYTVIDSVRQSNGKGSLEDAMYLNYTTRKHCNYMISRGFISHDYFYKRADELTEYFAPEEVGVVEIVACCFYDAESTVNAWMSSEPHKEAILSDSTHIVIGATTDEEGDDYVTIIFLTL